MPDDSLTHKDLSALTGVSETTIKSYRRKFTGFIPLRSRGKPLRFSPEAAPVCKRIRECFEKDLSVPEIRAVLQREFPQLPRNAGPEPDRPDRPAHPQRPAEAAGPGASTEALRTLSLVQQQQRELIDMLIDKCTSLASAQEETNVRLLKIQESFTDFLSLFLAREDLVGRGLESLDTHLRGFLERSENGMVSLAQEIGNGLADLRGVLARPMEEKSVLVRNAFGESTRYVFQSAAPEPGSAAEAQPRQAASEGVAEEEPPESLLAAPLVVRTDAGDYLGIAGRSEGAFSLQDFIALLRTSYPPPQHFSLDWLARDGVWVLLAEQAEAIRPLKYALHVEPSTTPKGNAVAVLQRLERNGREQPSPNLYTFIRRMRAMAAAREA